jgi:putative phosphoesterase
MKIAICSDIHDNIWKLESALKLMNGASELIFCGDFCAPFTLGQIADGFPGPIHAVYGNNDGDPRLLLQVAAKVGRAAIYGQFAELTLGGLKIAVNHYPEIARPLAESGRYDVVCYGHDHKVFQEQIGNCLLVNPGEIMGRFGRSTFMLLDTTDRSVTVIEAG